MREQHANLRCSRIALSFRRLSQTKKRSARSSSTRRRAIPDASSTPICAARASRSLFVVSLRPKSGLLAPPQHGGARYPTLAARQFALLAHRALFSSSLSDQKAVCSLLLN